MIIERDKTYKNDSLYNEFLEKSKCIKKIDCEVVFENMYNTKKETFDIIRVWFKDDLYGSSYIIRNGFLEIRSIDNGNDSKIDLTDKNAIDLIVSDLSRISKI